MNRHESCYLLATLWLGTVRKTVPSSPFAVIDIGGAGASLGRSAGAWPCRGAAVVTAGRLLVPLAVPWATSLAACRAATGAAEHTAAPLLRQDADFHLREIAAEGLCYPQEPPPAGSLSRTPRCRWAEVGSSSVEYDIIFTSRHLASPLLSLTSAAPWPGSCS